MERFASPNHGAADELNRIIGRLNADFGLQLRASAPAPQQQHHRSPEHLNDAIFEIIRALHYGRDRRLAGALGQFQIEARQILSCSRQGGTACPRLDRLSLQNCLLRILSDLHGAGQSKWKRNSEDGPDASHKRPRALKDHGYPSVVDDIPVRSRAAKSPDVKSDDGVEEECIPSTLVPSASRQTSFSGRSFASSQKSRPSAVFSACSRASAADSQTSIGSDYCLPEKYSAHQGLRSVSKSLSRGLALKSEYALASSASFGRRQVGSVDSVVASFRSTDQSPYSSSIFAPSSTPSTQSIHKGVHEIVSGSLEERLVNVWPKFPGLGFNEAPLAVIWEVTRAALHCRVNLGDLDLKYEPKDQWHEQPKLKARLSAHRLFAGKQLPHLSGSMAWKAALDGFQSKTKAVVLRAELVYNDDADGPLYKMRLLPLELELAHRLARRFGADRFLEMLLPSPTHCEGRLVIADGFDPDDLVRWLTQKPHNFLGRSWVPFYVRHMKTTKSSSNVYQERIYWFACHGHIFRPPRHFGSFPAQAEALTPGTRTTMRLSGLLEWAVNIRQNADQPVTKLFSRLNLSLSRTWPTVVLERSQIRFRAKDLGSDKVMNDGIGRMSRPLAIKISECLGLSDCPSAFQARLGSAKGMWIIDSNYEDPDEDWIEVYPSQLKWKCDYSDPLHRMFEVRANAKELRSAGLNQQFIPVLEAQSLNPAAMRYAISERLASALREDLASLTAAMEEPLDLRLWVQQSGLTGKRQSLDSHASFAGGLPSEDADKISFLLDCGFDQRRMQYMKDLVWSLCKQKAKTLKSKMNITIPCSAYVYMAADFSSTLEENQVHLSFSTKFQVDDFSDTLLEDMDILVARAPAHFPSDIQRVRVVSRPELRKLKDVIIFSTKGKIPLADKLSGGDYDGDLAWVCWDPKIVNNFRNAPVPTTANLFELKYLGKHVTKFQDLMTRAQEDATAAYDAPIDRACSDFIAEALSFSLRPSLLGQCTKYKEKLCYRDGTVTSSSAVELSALLSNLVDQSKQGILFSAADWKRFRQEHIKQPLFLDDPAYASDQAPRPSSQDGVLHVLDYMKFDVAMALIDETLTSLERAIKTANVHSFDADLVRLYNTLYDDPNAGSTGCKAVLDALREDVDRVARVWTSKAELNGTDEGVGFAAVVRQLHQQWFDIEVREELRGTAFAREVMRDWGREGNTSPWQLLKASATFKHHHRRCTFVWHMAGRQLGFIKSRMRETPGETAPVLVVPEMWRVLKADKRRIMGIVAERGRGGVESEVALEEVTEYDEDGTVIDDV